jgi:hypothetical protein
METLKKPKKTVADLDVILDDRLDERFGREPLFPEKIANATQIMAMVREKQGEDKKSDSIS